MDENSWNKSRWKENYFSFSFEQNIGRAVPLSEFWIERTDKDFCIRKSCKILIKFNCSLFAPVANRKGSEEHVTVTPFSALCPKVPLLHSHLFFIQFLESQSYTHSLIKLTNFLPSISSFQQCGHEDTCADILGGQRAGDFSL